MAIQPEAVAMTVDYWAGLWDKIVLLTADELEEAEKVPVVEALIGRVRSTVFFAHTEANFIIAKVRLYAGAVLVAENVSSVNKTDRQSLTVIRRDVLEAS